MEIVVSTDNWKKCGQVKKQLGLYFILCLVSPEQNLSTFYFDFPSLPLDYRSCILNAEAADF